MLKRLVLSSLMKMFLEEDCWSLFLKRGWMRDQRDTLTDSDIVELLLLLLTAQWILEMSALSRIRNNVVPVLLSPTWLWLRPASKKLLESLVTTLSRSLLTVDMD